MVAGLITLSQYFPNTWDPVIRTSGQPRLPKAGIPPFTVHMWSSFGDSLISQSHWGRTYSFTQACSVPPRPQGYKLVFQGQGAPLWPFQRWVILVLRQGLGYVAQANLELITLLLQPPKWDYRCAPPCLTQTWITHKNPNLYAELEGLTPAPRALGVALWTHWEGGQRKKEVFFKQTFTSSTYSPFLAHFPLLSLLERVAPVLWHWMGNDGDYNGLSSRANLPDQIAGSQIADSNFHGDPWKSTLGMGVPSFLSHSTSPFLWWVLR
jgi:hypothetical protein